LKKIKPISLIYSFLLFVIPGIVFYLIINFLVPYLANISGWTPYVVWIVTGTVFLFLPLFLLTFILLKRDGYALNWSALKERLMLKRITIHDLLWIIVGIIVCTMISVILIGLWKLLSPSFDINELKEMSPIKVNPLVGKERIALFFLPIFYFFNYFGEELMWRGYILPRQVMAIGKYAWPLNMVFHVVFHMAFSLKAMLFFIPFMLFLPYIVYKQKNTYLSIIIHFLLGAPTQLFIALGIFV
jgi:membrane protease YdiL (CAAX protease family)